MTNHLPRFAMLLMVMHLLACGPVIADIEPAPVPQTEARSSLTGQYISFKEHRIDDEGLTGVPMRGADGLAVADMDSDGNLDIVSCHEDSSHVRLAFGTEDPDIWYTATLASGEMVGSVEDAALGDLNGDGRVDIVCACERAHVVTFLAPDNPRQMEA